MALDYQMSVYRGRPPWDNKKRSTYSNMNMWMDVLEPAPNPFEEARQSVYSSLIPHVAHNAEAIPSPRVAPAKIPVPPPKPPPIKNDETQTEPIGAWVTPTVVKESSANRPHSQQRHLARPKKYNGPNLTKYQKQAIQASEHDHEEHPDARPVHLNYSKSGGYDDYHRAFLKLQASKMRPSYPQAGPPRIRHGKMGCGWRHVKEVLQAGGNRIVFVDGDPRVVDNRRITEGVIPLVNVLQRSTHGQQYRSAQERLLLSAYEHYLTGVKGQERNNWSVIR